MNRIKLFGATAIVAFAFAASADAATHPMVGGAAMYATKNIIENAINSKDHTTLVAAVKAGGLVEYARRLRAVHCVRPDQRSLGCAPARNSRNAIEAREQGNGSTRS